MIVPMKKVSFVVYAREYTQFLQRLQELGTVHLITKIGHEGDHEKLREKYQLIYRLSTMIKYMERRMDQDKVNLEVSMDGLEIFDEIENMRFEMEMYQQRLTSLRKELVLVEPWGDFTHSTIEALKKTGHTIRFYVVATKRYNVQWEIDFNAFVIGTAGVNTYFVTLTNGVETPQIEAEEVKSPEKSASQLRVEISDLENNLKKADETLTNFACEYVEAMRISRRKLRDSLMFDTVVESSEPLADNQLMMIEGWVPADKTVLFDAEFGADPVYFEFSDPDPKDSVPIKLKNNAFTRLFEPIGKLYMLPVYGELDLTPFFAPFFMLFFGFCLGDAGYGLIMLLFSLILLPKAKTELKPFLRLGAFFSISTIVFGVLSGTAFGINLIDSGYTLTMASLANLAEQGVDISVIEALKPLVGQTFESQDVYLKTVGKTFADGSLPDSYRQVVLAAAEAPFAWLQNIRYRMLNTQSMMYLSLAIGYVQIIFGMFLKTTNIVRTNGFKFAISSIGWIVIFFLGGILYLLMKIGALPTSVGTPLLYSLVAVGAAMVFFFNAPGKNIFMNMGLGLWDAYGMVSGFIGDLLSYIRLFALGLSSAVLGMVFNKLALGLLALPPGLGELLFVVLLLVGHTLNLFLAALGSFVHPMRLTFVEFYKNAGFAGGGKEFKPFSKTV